MAIKIVLDTLGSDKGIEEIVKGGIDASLSNSDLDLVFAGPKDEILKIIKESSNKEFEIIDAKEAITNLDNPIMAVRSKKESSLVKAMNYLNENDDALAFVSAGSTGAVLTSAIMKLKRIGNCRPVLTCMLPNEKGEFFCLADCGANADCKSEHLVDFAKMGSCFMSSMGIENPRIGLLSNGSEDKKGNALTKEVFPLLKESGLNFVGNIEGTKILSGEMDVLVCDGFSGNVVLKNIEGTAKTIIKDLYRMMKTAKSEEERNILGKTINSLMSKYDFNTLGGATLLGVNKVVVKAHGAATKETIVHTVNQAYTLVKNGILEKMNESLKESCE